MERRRARLMLWSGMLWSGELTMSMLCRGRFLSDETSSTMLWSGMLWSGELVRSMLWSGMLWRGRSWSEAPWMLTPSRDLPARLAALGQLPAWAWFEGVAPAIGRGRIAARLARLERDLDRGDVRPAEGERVEGQVGQDAARPVDVGHRDRVEAGRGRRQLGHLRPGDVLEGHAGEHGRAEQVLPALRRGRAAERDRRQRDLDRQVLEVERVDWTCPPGSIRSGPTGGSRRPGSPAVPAVAVTEAGSGLAGCWPTTAGTARLTTPAGAAAYDEPPLKPPAHVGYSGLSARATWAGTTAASPVPAGRAASRPETTRTRARGSRRRDATMIDPPTAAPGRPR